MLDEPILYLSLYLKQNRKLYYELLQEVPNKGAWGTWLEFFLEGIFHCSKQAVNTVNRINKLFENDLEIIASLGRIKFSCEVILEYMKKLPQVTVPLLANELDMSAPTARSALNKMMENGIIEEISGKKRDKVYIYRNYLNSLEEGAEPIK